MKYTPILLIPIAILAIGILAFLACQKDNNEICDEHTVAPCSEDPAKPNIRFINHSDQDFCNVVVNLTGDFVNCGNLKKGAATCYRSFDGAFRYGYVEFMANGKNYTAQPTDYVGETPLGKGNFSYVLNISGTNEHAISIDFMED